MLLLPVTVLLLPVTVLLLPVTVLLLPVTVLLLPVTGPQPFQFQLVSIAEIFTYSVAAALFPPSGTANLIVRGGPVLCS